MIFGMLDFSLMDDMGLFHGTRFLVGKPNFGPLPGDPEGMDYTSQCFCFCYLLEAPSSCNIASSRLCICLGVFRKPGGDLPPKSRTNIVTKFRFWYKHCFKVSVLENIVTNILSMFRQLFEIFFKCFDNCLKYSL